MINENTKVVAVSTKFIASDLGDEMILMNLESGDYIALNHVSAEIWKRAEKVTTVQQVIEHLLQQYNVDKETCQQEAQECIQLMLQKELLTVQK